MLDDYAVAAGSSWIHVRYHCVGILHVWYGGGVCRRFSGTWIIRWTDGKEK